MDFELWKKNRRKTLLSYLTCGFAYGVDYYLVIVTIIPYYDNLVHSKKSQFYYGLNNALYYVIASLAGMVLARYVDRTRSVKNSLYVCISCGIMGSLVYTLYFYPVIPIVGRAIASLIASIRATVIGEIIRTYDGDEGAKVQWWYAAACSVGYVVGSWISITFISINFHIGPMIINQHNFVGIFLASLWIIVYLIVYVFAHDCSKEYDLKAALLVDEGESKQPDGVKEERKGDVEECAAASIRESGSMEENFNDEATKKDSIPSVIATPSISIVLRGFIHLPDISLVMASTFVYSSVGWTLDLMTPLLVLKVFNWWGKSLDILYAISSLIFFIIMMLFSKFCTSNKTIYNITISCIISALATLSFLLVILSNTFTLPYQITLMAVYQLAYLPVWFLDTVTLPNMLGRMVYSHMQSFTESVRGSLSLVSCIMCSLVIALDVDTKVWASVLMLFSFILLLLIIVRRKQLMNIRAFDFEPLQEKNSKSMYLSDCIVDPSVK